MVAENRVLSKMYLYMQRLKNENTSGDMIEELKLEDYKDAEGTAFVAFARVFSGTLKPGQEVYVLGPKYQPTESLRKLKENEEVCDVNATIKV